MQERSPEHLEVEWQFDADDLNTIESWLRGHPSVSGFTVVPGKTLELADTYYDTEDWRFYRAGYALRIRRDGERVEATMKALASGEAGLKRRREISEPLGSGGVEVLQRAGGPVGERARLLSGTRELRPLFEVRTRRRIFELRPGEEGAFADGSSGEIVVGPTGEIHRKEKGTVSSGEVVVDALGGIHRREPYAVAAEVALDETEVSGGEEKGRLGRVEIEVADGKLGGEVAGFVDALRSSLELRPTQTSKFGTGLSVAGLSPTATLHLGPTQIDESLTVGEVAFAILRRHFATMLDHEPGVRLGEDPEELHDMRVATRRLRAALKLYASVLPERAERFEQDLKWVAGTLGEVRDLDVHLQHLVEEFPEDEEAVGEIVAALEGRRTEARRRMLEALDSGRYERLVSGFSGMLRGDRSPAPTEPIVQAAPNLIEDRYKKVRKRIRRLDEHSPPEYFHDVRKKGKRLRYAVEPLQNIYGKPADRIVERLKELQDGLGGHQDFVVYADLMRELAFSGKLPPRTVFWMGSMADRYAREAARRRASLLDSKSLRDLDKKWKRLRKVMEEKAGG